MSENTDTRVEVRVKAAFDNGDDSYEAGEFLKIDPDVSEEWAEDGLVEQVSREAYAERERKRLEQEAREQRRRQREKSRNRVERVHDSFKDDPTGGYGQHGFGEFCKDVAVACRGANGVLSEKLRAWNSHTKTNAVEYDDSQGGYLVPGQFINTLYKTSLENTVAVSRCKQIPMETNRVSIPAVAVTSHASTLFGGITLYRPGEDEVKTASKPLFRQIELTAHKLVGLINVSDELIEDSPATVGAIMTEMFTEAIAFHRDRDVLRGTGVNQPLGVLNAGCLVPQAIEAGQTLAANPVVIENIVNMWSRMFPSCHKNAVWLVNQAVLPHLYTMGLAVGTGGSAVFMPAGGASGSPYATLMGRPLIATEKLPTLGTAGDILLADFGQYVVADKGGVKTDQSMHLYFNYDRTCFRFVFRGDGQPLWNSALTPNDGGNTLSPFVVLAART